MKKARLIHLTFLMMLGIIIGGNAQDCVKTVRCSRLDSAMKNEKKLLIVEEQLTLKQIEIDSSRANNKNLHKDLRQKDELIKNRDERIKKEESKTLFYKSKVKRRNKFLLILLPIAIIPYLKYIPQ